MPDLFSHAVMTREDERAAFARYFTARDKHGLTHKRTLAARDAIVLGNMRLVAKVAAYYGGPASQGIPFEELVQEGVIGLIVAIDRFDLGRQLRFSTYATWWVRHEVRRAIADKARTVRIPVGKQEQKYAESKSGVSGSGKDSLDDGVSLWHGFSLDAPPPRAELGWHDILAADAASPEEQAAANEEARRVQEATKRLSRLDQAIVKARFGFAVAGRPRDPLTLRKVSELLPAASRSRNGVLSKERVRQMEVDALGKIKRDLTPRPKGILRDPKE